MIGGPVDVELLPAFASVAVADETEVLEHVECSIHRRRRRGRIDLARSLDELGARDVTVDGRQDLEQDAALGRPAQPAGTEPATDVGPAIDAAIRVSARGGCARGSR